MNCNPKRASYDLDNMKLQTTYFCLLTAANCGVVAGGLDMYS